MRLRSVAFGLFVVSTAAATVALCLAMAAAWPVLAVFWATVIGANALAALLMEAD